MLHRKQTKAILENKKNGLKTDIGIKAPRFELNSGIVQTIATVAFVFKQ